MAGTAFAPIFASAKSFTDSGDRRVDIRAEARRFYGLFYQQEPSDAQLDGLLADPPA